MEKTEKFRMRRYWKKMATNIYAVHKRNVNNPIQKLFCEQGVSHYWYDVSFFQNTAVGTNLSIFRICDGDWRHVDFHQYSVQVDNNNTSF